MRVTSRPSPESDTAWWWRLDRTARRLPPRCPMACAARLELFGIAAPVTRQERRHSDDKLWQPSHANSDGMLGFCARLSARSGGGNKPCNPAEYPLDWFAVIKPGDVAPGYFSSCRQVRQGEANRGEGNPCRRRNLRVELLSVLLQVLENCRGVHFDFLSEDQGRESSARIDHKTTTSPVYCRRGWKQIQQPYATESRKNNCVPGGTRTHKPENYEPARMIVLCIIPNITASFLTICLERE